MIFEFVALSAAATAPAHGTAASRPPISMFDAVIATAGMPAVTDLTKAAVFIKDGGKGAILGVARSGSIA